MGGISFKNLKVLQQQERTVNEKAVFKLKCNP